MGMLIPVTVTSQSRAFASQDHNSVFLLTYRMHGGYGRCGGLYNLKQKMNKKCYKGCREAQMELGIPLYHPHPPHPPYPRQLGLGCGLVLVTSSEWPFNGARHRPPYPPCTLMGIYTSKGNQNMDPNQPSILFDGSYDITPKAYSTTLHLLEIWNLATFTNIC